MSSNPPPETPPPAPRLEPGDQLIAYLEHLMNELAMQGLLELDPSTERCRLTEEGRKKVGAPARTGVYDRDLVAYLRRLGSVAGVEELPHVL